MEKFFSLLFYVKYLYVPSVHSSGQVKQQKKIVTQQSFSLCTIHSFPRGILSISLLLRRR